MRKSPSCGNVLVCYFEFASFRQVIAKSTGTNSSDVWYHWVPSGTIGYHWVPFGTIGDHWEPLGKVLVRFSEFEVCQEADRD